MVLESRGATRGLPPRSRGALRTRAITEPGGTGRVFSGRLRRRVRAPAPDARNRALASLRLLAGRRAHDSLRARPPRAGDRSGVHEFYVGVRRLRLARANVTVARSRGSSARAVRP